MPFSIPILPMMVVALLIAAILPAILNVRSRHDGGQDSVVPSAPKQTTEHELSSVDPFSEVPDVTATGPQTDGVRISTKFVEITSGTEELSFDWIVPCEHAASKE